MEIWDIWSPPPNLALDVWRVSKVLSSDIDILKQMIYSNTRTYGKVGTFSTNTFSIGNRDMGQIQ